MKDDEKSWLLSKRAMPLTATGVGRHAGVSKYDTVEGVYVRKLFDPDYALQPNIHMARGVACEDYILQELYQAEDMIGMGSELMTSDWDLASGATPDGNAVKDGVVVNIEAKAPVILPPDPPVAYISQQHQQCATMHTTKSYLTMSDTKGHRRTYRMDFFPPFHTWCLRRSRRIKKHLDAEIPPGSFSKCMIHEHVGLWFHARGNFDSFIKATRQSKYLPLRRKPKSGAMAPACPAMPEELLPPFVPGITAPDNLAYHRMSVGKQAMREGILEREI